MNRGDDWASVVYDGLGLELEASPPVLDLACARCAAAMPLSLRRVLGEPRAATRIGAGTLAGRFGLVLRGEGEWASLRARLDLTPYALDVECPACGARHVAVIGYGEYQPARYLAVLQGHEPIG